MWGKGRQRVGKRERRGGGSPMSSLLLVECGTQKMDTRECGGGPFFYEGAGDEGRERKYCGGTEGLYVWCGGGGGNALYPALVGLVETEGGELWLVESLDWGGESLS